MSQKKLGLKRKQAMETSKQAPKAAYTDEQEPRLLGHNTTLGVFRYVQ